MRRITAAAIAALLAIGIVASLAIAAGPTKPATVKVRSTSLGKIIVDGSGRTLYLFEKDKGTKSNCSGACAKAWPPLLTKGKPKAGTGARASKLGTTKRSDGTTQVTYGGHPVYRFIVDKNKPGSVKGQGSNAFGAEWYVVAPSGKKIEKSSSSSSYRG
jgi:predicted lipoprotein with Yx(FWY)xxD motif